jgi:hypothetical protein
MTLNQTLKIATFILIILAIAMIYIGGFHAKKLMLPPIITGIGFIVIAKVFWDLQKK